MGVLYRFCIFTCPQRGEAIGSFVGVSLGGGTSVRFKVKWSVGPLFFVEKERGGLCWRKEFKLTTLQLSL